MPFTSPSKVRFLRTGNFFQMRHTSWLNSFLSLNHLPSLPHAKKLIKLPSYLFIFLRNRLSLSPSTEFLWYLCSNREKYIWVTARTFLKNVTGCSERSIHGVHHGQALPTRWGWICIHDASLFLFPDYPLTSLHPFPSTHTTTHTQITKGNSRSGMRASLPQQQNTFRSLSITAHLAGCLFLHSAYSAKVCSLERFQLWNSRKWF